MKKIIIMICIIFVACNRTENKNINESIKSEDFDFTVFHADTLKSDILNKIKYEFVNKEFDEYPNRYLDVYYIIKDSIFNGNIKDLEGFEYGVLTNAKKKDTLYINSFKEKGRKIITFFIYDEVEIPVNKDSVRVLYNIHKFGSPTFIK